jgi:spermidine synthase
VRLNLRGIFLLLFALSGFSGLIYESIWTNYLKLFLGHAAYAQTLVLAIFMGGMAIGSAISSRYSLRWKNLLLCYAFVEGVIGLCALPFHTVFGWTIDYSYSIIIPHLNNPVVVNAFKWTISALLILPQSVLLGMTFPLMSAGVLRLFPEKPGSTVAMLYFSNSIGAAAGVLVSGFVLIRLVGLPGTMGIAGLINIVLASIVWYLLKKPETPGKAVGSKAIAAQGPGRKRSKAKTKILPAADGYSSKKGTPELQVTVEKSSPGAGPVPVLPSWYRVFLFVSLVTGAASFIYEIGWIRMLSLVLGSSTHSFELMLSAFILGLALGGLWIHWRIERTASPVRFLALVQVSMGLLALLTLPLYGTTFSLMQWLVKTLSKTDTGYLLFNLSSSAIAMAVMLPATFCAGMTLPLITFILIKGGQGERSIGAVYAANTIGAIIGVFFAVHAGLPLLGLKNLITCGAGLDIALGVGLFWFALAESGDRRLPVIATVTGVCAVAATIFLVQLDPYKMGSGVYRTGEIETPEEFRVLYHKDGKTATVNCFQRKDGLTSIRTNGKVDASIMMARGSVVSPDE